MHQDAAKRTSERFHELGKEVEVFPSKVASYLRQREPDDEIGYSILVYRLTDDEVARALADPPAELLPEPEWEAENRRYGLETSGP